MKTPIKIQVDQDIPRIIKQLCGKGHSISSSSFGVYSRHTYIIKTYKQAEFYNSSDVEVQCLKVKFIHLFIIISINLFNHYLSICLFR